MTLHPQAAAHLAATADAEGVASLTVPQVRRAMRGYLDLQRPGPPMAGVEHRFMPGPTADLPIRVLRPVRTVEPTPVIVVLHGSGWVAANLDMVDEPARVLAADTGFAVVTVGYQKAPEHPYPTPLDDAIAAVRWVVEQADELSVDPSRLAIVGDSAGGNLAAASTAALVADDVPVAAQALLYPALDRRQDTESYRTFARGFGLDDVDMAWFWDHYVGLDLADDPRVSPLRASSFSALPPTYVATAGHDVLRDEGERYAAALRDAGVDDSFDGMIHGFWWMDGVLDDARELQRRLAAFLTDRVG
jgi:acetyl esterase